MLNWIFLNRTIYIKMDLALNNLPKLICHKNLTNQIVCLQIIVTYSLVEIIVDCWQLLYVLQLYLWQDKSTSSAIMFLALLL